MTHQYRELRAYSPLTDCDMVRISMANTHGHELFMMLTDRGARREYRAKREAALTLLAEAVDAGIDPGQLRVADEVWKQAVNEAMRERVS